MSRASSTCSTSTSTRGTRPCTSHDRWALELAENPNTYAPLRPGDDRIVTDRFALARGRGAYRALVHARWQDAVQRGTPLAVRDAGSRSRPILARMGFREVCTMRALIDRFQ